MQAVNFEALSQNGYGNAVKQAGSGPRVETESGPQGVETVCGASRGEGREADLKGRGTRHGAEQGSKPKADLKGWET